MAYASILECNKLEGEKTRGLKQVKLSQKGTPDLGLMTPSMTVSHIGQNGS